MDLGTQPTIGDAASSSAEPSLQQPHTHNIGCGHTMIFHDDHVGYFQDGELFCMTDVRNPTELVKHTLAQPPSKVQGHGHSHGGKACHGHGHGAPAAQATQGSQPAQPAQPEQGHGHSHGGKACHGHGHGASTPQATQGGQPAQPEQGHGHSHDKTGHGHSHDNGGDHGHGHSHGSKVVVELEDPAHIHSDECGHEKVRHGDHFDYLVGNQLQPSSKSQACAQVDRFVPRHFVYQNLAKSQALTTEEADSQALAELGISASPELLKFFAKSTKGSWYKDSNMRRFVLMFFLTGSFLFVELIVGLAIGSLALVSDAFHMLSDLIGLIVGFGAVKLSLKRTSKSNTFHYGRAEVVGAMINSVFLISVCFMITLEAIQRLITLESDSKLEGNAILLLLVASGGLAMNLVGLVIFGGHGHGHSHGGHGHSHGGGHGHAHDDQENETLVGGRHKDHGNLNVQGVFLHILGDALGSIAAIISGLVIWLSDSKYRTLADPLCTLAIAIIIFSGTIPLIRKSLPIMLDSVPESVDLLGLKEELLKINGVEAIHDLHVWAISPRRILGSLHVLLSNTTDANVVLIQMKMVCHKYSIHSTTIQPEFVNAGTLLEGATCLEPYCKNEDCLNAFCCVPVQQKK